MALEHPRLRALQSAFARVKQLIAIAVCFASLLMAASMATGAPAVQVCFTPEYGRIPSCTGQIISTIGTAKRTILVQAYSFTSAPIAKALVEAHRRGVEVKVVLDKRANTGHYSDATFLEHMGIAVLIDAQHAIAHNKVMVIDGETVITGSFNFTKAAEEHNAENVIIIHDPSLAAMYMKNWDVHASHSQPFIEEQANGASVSTAAVTQAEQGSANTNHGAPAGPIVGNRRSHIYAWPGCRSYNTMSPSNRVVFSDAQTAEQAGYHAARNCR